MRCSADQLQIYIILGIYLIETAAALVINGHIDGNADSLFPLCHQGIGCGNPIGQNRFRLIHRRAGLPADKAVACLGRHGCRQFHLCSANIVFGRDLGGRCTAVKFIAHTVKIKVTACRCVVDDQRTFIYRCVACTVKTVIQLPASVFQLRAVYAHTGSLQPDIVAGCLADIERSIGSDQICNIRRIGIVELHIHCADKAGGDRFPHRMECQMGGHLHCGDLSVRQKAAAAFLPPAFEEIAIPAGGAVERRRFASPLHGCQLIVKDCLGVHTVGVDHGIIALRALCFGQVKLCQIIGICGVFAFIADLTAGDCYRASLIGLGDRDGIDPAAGKICSDCLGCP